MPELSVIHGTINGSGRCANTNRTLTRSLDSSKEGLAMNATPAKICSADGCDTRSRRNAMCPMHAARLYRTGRLDTRDPVRRFWEHVDKESGSPCWLWTGIVLRSGYGQLRVEGARVATHRFSYELHKGPIPEGLTIDHVYDWGCRNRHCVNPDHLEAVTQAENNRRARAVRR